jgi:hypothetical protein
MMRRSAGLIASILLTLASAAYGQTPPAPATPSADVGAAGSKTWSCFASMYTFVLPDATDYVQPVFTADRDRLHLEARYNYEGQRTGSLWIGYRFSGGHAVEWELTPLAGVVFGDTKGGAPGYKGSLTWRRLELYSESEYVIDGSDASQSFLYNWSELTVAPVEALKVGLVVQRTHVYQTDRDIQRGIIVGYSYRRAELTAIVFNPDEDHPVFAFSVGFNF